MNNPLQRTIIALAGPIAAGKTTAARILGEQMDFTMISTRDVLAGIIRSDGVQPTDTSLLEYGARVMSGVSAARFCDELARATEGSRLSVIDSLRPLLHWRHLQQHIPEARLLFIQASDEVRRTQYAARTDRDASAQSFERRTQHEVESEVTTLRDQATAVVVNDGRDGFREQLLAMVHVLMHGRRPALFRDMVSSVRQFHVKHGYHVGDGDKSVMSLRVGLMIEELGEIHECISKGKDGIEEEHADLLYLLIGDAVSLGFDLESAFLDKHLVNMQRESKKTPVGARVSSWE